MSLKLVVGASHHCVACEFVNFISDDVLNFVAKETIKNCFSAVDIKKWRIAHTFVVYKSDDS